MPQNKLRLVWDINLFSVRINDIDIVVAPKTLAPFDIDAVVEEQDTALIISEPGIITGPDDKPAWLLANKLESQSLLKPGSVIKRGANPLRLLAIVHDLDREPSWLSEWIAQALDNIIHLSYEQGFSSIQLSVLGAQHGRFDLEEFLQLLVIALNKAQGKLKKIWLVVPQEDCSKALSILKEAYLHTYQKGVNNMNPIITVEFSANTNVADIKEESVALHNPEELFSFVAPGGGCEKIPSEVSEIQMIFLTPEHPNIKNPIADKRVMLQLGIVFFTGPLSEIMQTMEQLIDKVGRNELSDSFLKVIGC